MLKDVQTVFGLTDSRYIIIHVLQVNSLNYNYIYSVCNVVKSNLDDDLALIKLQ